MLVRARDDIYNMKDLKGKKIGLSKSLNVIKKHTESTYPDFDPPRFRP